MTEYEKIAYFEELEEKAKTDKVAWIEFEIERMKHSLEATNGNVVVRSMELLDKIQSLSDTYRKRFECVSSRVLYLERQNESLMWVSAFAIGVSIVSLVAGIIGG